MTARQAGSRRSGRPAPSSSPRTGTTDHVARQRREAARTRDLTALLQQRPDLAGVHLPADFTAEAVRWCV